MPIAEAGMTPQQMRAYNARVSTPEPVAVPRWESPVGAPDLSPLLSYTPGTVTTTQSQPATMGLQKLGLSTLSLDAPSALSLTTPSESVAAMSYMPKASYEPGKVVNPNSKDTGMPKNMGGFGSTKSGNLGPGAYGFSGRTGTSNLRGKSPFGFQAPMWQALSAANAAMKAAGLGTFGITDGFRSYDAQVATKAKKGNLAATPGRSIHGLGLAADLRISDKQFQWLKKNGARYGLVNLPSESWHWQLQPDLWNG